ncbi:sigma 54-interacting transcriptional regulator [Ensifer adhaerens]|uniref:sigma-54 interaction domain-containing protein n=1 Tax=Ensifer adhaerens TaxID=106592 RepID=UPI001CBD7132|nr:sigma 54-interacting transcriptional regulator [Ensifer adhaerens]MBZ7921476.1 sigma 54-interacting transcriptional regulator [Ensifer adhaerens]UAX93901.1 sigma 54-interacting transcriptional regulator [Ensifer adhaerens]UAY01536.1 sigma 54-interacting transcriptional regulator [Ensifer adhaerens]UAY08919.1 sigma 54-interacting transcriptional regulator [Ensifer adhaerens]
MALPEWLAGSSEEAGFLRLVLDHVSDCLVAVDTEGAIVLINEPYCRLLGGEAEDFLGRHITDVVGPQTKLHFVARGVGTHVGYPLEVHGHKLVTKQVPVHKDGRIIGAVGLALFSDYDALKKTYSRISKAELAIPSKPKAWQSKFGPDEIIGTGQVMDAHRETLKVAAAYDLPVMIFGETGAGKELSAHSIHALSERSAGPFVWVNCASIPSELIEAELFGYEGGAFTGARSQGKPGKVELAAGGVLFLDEIGDMPLSLQGSLLRVLQTGEIVRVGGTSPVTIDLRIICATNKSLADLVRSGRFREDLYHRLSVLPISVPSLRERDDLSHLADRLLIRIAANLRKPPPTLTAEDRKLLSVHTWPGNVRELENALTRFIVTGKLSILSLNEHRHLSFSDAESDLRTRLRSEAHASIRSALEQTRGNKQHAAKLLGISRAQFYRLWKELPLS